MAYWLEGARARPENNTHPEHGGTDAAVLASTRVRLRLALIVSLVIAGLLSFAVFPARRVAVVADGEAVTIVSRINSTNSLLELAGVEPLAGDVVLQQGNTLILDRATPVLLHVDDQTLGWRTRTQNIESLLREMGIAVSPYDGLRFNGREVHLQESLTTDDIIDLTIIRAVPLILEEDGVAVSLESSRATVAEVLADQGIVLGPADTVIPPLESPVVAGMSVQVSHARTLYLSSGGEVQTLYTQAATLREALAEIGMVLGEEDRIEPSLDSPVEHEMSARLVRVTGLPYYERETIERKLVFRPDPELSGYQTRRVNGNDGVSVQEYRIVIEDGVETEKTFVRQYFEPEVADDVIYYPAGAAASAGVGGSSFHVADTMHVWATWYNPASSGKPAGHPAYNVTFTGTPVIKGTVAVDPAVIPLGTVMYIPGYGFGVAADTGGGIIGDMIDLGFPDGAQSDWHTGWVDIYILTP